MIPSLVLSDDRAESTIPPLFVDRSTREMLLPLRRQHELTLGRQDR
jgi:hypothetical protein